MGHIDEKIIFEQNKYKKESVGDVYNGYLIKEEKYTFNQCFFFDGKMSIYLPEGFMDLPEDLAKLKYPSENRPQIIKSSIDNTINIAFNLLEVDMTNEAVLEMIKSFKNIIKNVNPSNRFLDEGMEVIANNKNLAWFDFLSNGLDGTIYTIVVCSVVENKLLHCVFNCMEDSMVAWKKVALDMFKSISAN